MFSYSTGYYVSPPDDQYLKFKNRCSLLSSLVSDIRLGTGKGQTFFYSVPLWPELHYAYIFWSMSIAERSLLGLSATGIRAYISSFYCPLAD